MHYGNHVCHMESTSRSVHVVGETYIYKLEYGFLSFLLLLLDLHALVWVRYVGQVAMMATRVVLVVMTPGPGAPTHMNWLCSH